MPTTVVKTVKSSGGDYTSLSNWEAGQQADITAGGNDTIQVAECYASAGPDTANVVIDGWTTDSTHYISIIVPATERHDGKRNSGKYRLHAGADFSACFYVTEDYIRIDGLQVKNTSAIGNGVIYFVGGGEISLSNTLVYDSVTATNVGAIHTTIGNTILNNVAIFNTTGLFGSGGVGFHQNLGVAYICNSVALNNAYYGFRLNANNNLLTNVYAGGNGTDFANIGGSTLTNCPSADGTGTSTVALGTSIGTCFTNITPGSEDVHISSTSSALYHAGTNLEGDPHWINPAGYKDVDGDDYFSLGNWSIGADEFDDGGGDDPLIYISSDSSNPRLVGGPTWRWFVFTQIGDGTENAVIGTNSQVTTDPTGSQTAAEDPGTEITFTAVAPGASDISFTGPGNEQHAEDFIYSFSGISFDAPTKHLGQNVTVGFTYDDGGVGLSKTIKITNGTTEITVPSNGASISLSGATVGTYHVKITFPDYGGYTDEFPGTTLEVTVAAPSKPTDLATAVISSGRVDITWTNPGNSDNAPSLYRIQVATDSGFTSIVQTQTSDTESISITGLSANTHYWFRVRAENDTGNSAYSDPANGTTSAAPSIGSVFRGRPLPGSLRYRRPMGRLGA